MIGRENILETIRMFEEENLDIRTITMGISLLDCIDSDGENAEKKFIQRFFQRPGNLSRLPKKSKKNTASRSPIKEFPLHPFLLLPEPAVKRTWCPLQKYWTKRQKKSASTLSADIPHW